MERRAHRERDVHGQTGAWRGKGRQRRRQEPTLRRDVEAKAQIETGNGARRQQGAATEVDRRALSAK